MNTTRRIVLEKLKQQMKELCKGLETQQSFEKQQEIEKHLENVIDLYLKLKHHRR